MAHVVRLYEAPSASYFDPLAYRFGDKFRACCPCLQVDGGLAFHDIRFASIPPSERP